MIKVYRSDPRPLYHLPHCVVWKPDYNNLSHASVLESDLSFGCDTGVLWKECIGVKLSKKEKHFATMIKKSGMYHLLECPLVVHDINRYQFRYSSLCRPVECSFCAIEFPLVAVELGISDEMVELGCPSALAVEFGRFCKRRGFAVLTL